MLFKLSNLNSNLSLTLGYLNLALNNLALISKQKLPVTILTIFVSAGKLLQDNSISEALKVQTRLAYFCQFI